MQHWVEQTEGGQTAKSHPPGLLTQREGCLADLPPLLITHWGGWGSAHPAFPSLCLRSCCSFCLQCSSAFSAWTLAQGG